MERLIIWVGKCFGWDEVAQTRVFVFETCLYASQATSKLLRATARRTASRERLPSHIVCLDADSSQANR